MNRETRLVWLGTGVAVAVVWVVGLTVGRREPAHAPESATEPIALADPGEPVARAPMAGPMPAKPVAPQAANPPSATPDMQERKNPSKVLPFAFTDEETPDPYWAKDAEASIRSAFTEAHVPEGALLSVECRRRICRAEMWFDPREHLAFGRAYATLRQHFGVDIGFEQIANGIRGEPERVAAFFPRQGYPLQSFESPPR